MSPHCTATRLPADRFIHNQQKLIVPTGATPALLSQIATQTNTLLFFTFGSRSMIFLTPPSIFSYLALVQMERHPSPSLSKIWVHSNTPSLSDQVRFHHKALEGQLSKSNYNNNIASKPVTLVIQPHHHVINHNHCSVVLLLAVSQLHLTAPWLSCLTIHNPSGHALLSFYHVW